MCFSATASFTAGSMLNLVGLLSLSYARSVKQRMLAAVPFFFGIQQIAEGFVWRGMETGNDTWVYYGSYTFLFFAFFFWPVWVPLTMRTLVKNQTRKHILTALLALGVGIGLFLIYHITAYGFNVDMFNCHIRYSPFFEETAFISTTLYLLVTVLPFFIVPNLLVNLMGVAIGVSYIITYLFYVHALISVWCFFAAIISFFSVCLIYNLNQARR